jgi:hypothetical protein
MAQMAHMTLLAAWHTLDAAELRARCRAMQALARLLGGPVAAQLVAALRQAETDPASLPHCDVALDAVPTILLRRILASFAATLPGDSCGSPIPPPGTPAQGAVSPLRRRDEEAAGQR